MSDYQHTPVYRERHRRRTRYRLSKTTTFFRAALHAGVVFFALCAAVLFFAVLTALSGCTAMSAQERAALKEEASGCFCAGSECKKIVSASGASANLAAGGRSARQIEINRTEQ